MATEKIDALDKKILDIVTRNARIPSKNVAIECGVSRAAIHQRIQRLIELKVITGSGYNVDPKVLGLQTCTYIGIRLERGSRVTVGVSLNIPKNPLESLQTICGVVHYTFLIVTVATVVYYNGYRRVTVGVHILVAYGPRPVVVGRKQNAIVTELALAFGCEGLYTHVVRGSVHIFYG